MRHKLIKAALLGAAAITFTSCTVRQVEHQAHTVTVTGSGQVEVKSDQALIHMAVETHNADVLSASQQNADLMKKVREALIAFGIPEANLQNTDYSIYQQEVPGIRNTRNNQYTVHSQLTIVLKDLEKAGEAIDTAIAAGANSLSGIEYSVSQKVQEDAIKQARLLAVKQAEENASLFATSSGAALGTIVNITELSGNNPRRQLAGTMTSKTAATTPISAADMLVGITISATYELK